MASNRPRGREKNVTGQGKDIKRRESGLGTGPVGSSGGYQGRPGGGNSGGQRDSGGRSSGGGLLKIIIIVAALLFGGGSGLGSLLGGDIIGNMTGTSEQIYDISSIYGNLGGGSTSSGWDNGSNTGTLNTSVDASARAKYTNILGNGKDKTTIMIYLCGTDLESRSKMATSDIQEMINANISDNVNILLYSGGCKSWQNDAMSSKTNQIWQVKDDGLVCLEKDLGSKSMTDPSTLSSFIQWCARKYPANRNSLIFWDHGGGTVSGFGYDEKFASSGSMSLAEIDKALAAGGVKFDFVGFDACLMATTENAIKTRRLHDCKRRNRTGYRLVLYKLVDKLF